MANTDVSSYRSSYNRLARKQTAFFILMFSSCFAYAQQPSSDLSTDSLNRMVAQTMALPSYCTTGGPQLWQNLVSCGWPGPSNTGFPAGTTLRNTSGRTITIDNTVIDGERINGSIKIRARNVIIRNSYISYDGGGAGGSGVISIDPGFNATIDHVEINGLNHTHSCIWHAGSSMTVTAVNCHGVNDGIFSWAQSGRADSGDNVIIRDSYFHDFTTNAANGHIDGYQTEGAANGLIGHNTYDMPGNATSAISIWNSQKTSDNWTIQNNLVTGAGFTFYAEDYNGSSGDAAENVANSPVGGFSVTKIKYLDNRFSTSQWPHAASNNNSCVGVWGTWFYRGRWTPYYGGPTDLWNQGGSLRSGNIVVETGQNIDRGGPSGCEGANSSPLPPVSSDTKTPSVSIVSPASGSAISGSVTVIASASDNVGVIGVDVFVDNVFLFSDTASPFSRVWNTTGVSNGTHVLSARAYDAAGNVGTSVAIPVTVSNADLTAPSIPLGLTAVAASSSQINISWSASTDNVAVAGYKIYRNGTQIATTSSRTYSNTGLSPATTYNYRVAAYDTSGNASAQSVTATATTPSGTSSILSALYNFNTGSGGSAADTSGNGNIGAIVGAAWTSSGKYGAALSFNGVNSYVSAADSNSLDLSGAGTIEGWTKLNRLGIWHGIIGKGNVNADEKHNYALEVNSGNRAICILGNGISRNIVASTAILSSGVFTHLACTWDGTTLRVYVNGALNGSSPQTITPAANTSPLYIGQYGGSSDFANATIDEVRIYRRALLMPEILTDMNPQ